MFLTFHCNILGHVYSILRQTQDINLSSKYKMSKKSPFAQLAATNHSLTTREVNDYYATDPKAVDALIDAFPELKQKKNLYEPFCGEGHLSKKLKEYGFNVLSSDLIDRGYGKCEDFLSVTEMPSGVQAIVTNPPYKNALTMVQHALKIMEDGQYACMFLKLLFLESFSRYDELFSVNPPKYVIVSTKRIVCAKNGDFEEFGKSSAVCYAWFIWEKGFEGEPMIRWCNYN